MISLTVKAVDGGTNKYGKQVSELQTGITIDDDSISGTLNNVIGFTGFNASDESEQSGHYLALEVEIPDEATVTTQLINGKNGPVDMTEDGFCVYRITDNDNQQIKFTVTKGSDSTEKVYDLSGLTLNPAG